MKQWKKALITGLLISVASQLYWNMFVDHFRISTSVILLPILIMTFGIELHTRTICSVTAVTVFFFRLMILFFKGVPIEQGIRQVFPNALFYILYGIIFKLLIKNKHIAKIEQIIPAVFICDFTSNLFEVFFQEEIQKTGWDASIIKYLILIAAVRTLFVGLILIAERQYRTLLRKSEHENRYQRLFLMTTGLKNEIYFMHKNSEEIERVMSNAYRLYEKISTMELPEEMQQMALAIARDVHEIKKDYIRIIRGIEQEIDEDYHEEKVSFHDILQILEASTYRMMDNKEMSVRLQFDCQDDFMTREHYMLMVVLKNLVNNAIEAIEKNQKEGWVHISEEKKEGSYIFTVEDNGPGISKRHLPNIFKMGYSTKFDEKTGNIYRGVGLCGVKNAVEEHFHGSIRVDSVQGKGTKFQVIIPVHELEES